MEVTGLNKWYVTGKIRVWCGAVDDDYGQPDTYVYMANTTKRKTAAREMGKKRCHI